MTQEHLPNVIFIHGSGQSELSFNYIDVFLPNRNSLYLNYQIQENIDDIVSRFVEEIHKSFPNGPVYFVSHSYGCLLAAVTLTRIKNKTEKVIAMSAPWGGSQTAKWLSIVFRDSKLFTNTAPGSDFLKSVHNIETHVPIINLITTGTDGVGNDLAGLGKKSNDGLITTATQKNVPKGLSNVINIEVPLSHSEVLLSYDIIDILTKYIFSSANT